MAVGGVAARLSLGRSRGRLPKLPSVARDDAAEPPPDEDPFALLVAEIKLAAALDEPSTVHKAPTEPAELRDALYASRRLNNVLLAQLRDERARRADAELPAAPEKVRPLSASVGLHALRRLSVSSSNLGEGRPRRASSANLNRAATGAPYAELLGGKPAARKARRVAPSLRAGALLPSAADDAVAAAPAAEEAWPEPLTSPLKAPSGAPPWKAPPTPTTPATAARRPAFSRALLRRVQREIERELSRLQTKTQALLESPDAFGDKEEAAAQLRSLARRLGWLRSDLALLLPHWRRHADAKGATGGAGGENADADAAAEAAAGAAEVPRLCELAAASEDFASSLRRELGASAAVAAEESYEKAVNDGGLRTVAVARDGDCAFGCAAAWLADPAGAAAAARLRRNAADSADAGAPSLDAFSLRRLVVETLRRRLHTEAPGPTGGVGARMDAAVAEALASSSLDGTSVRLRQAARALVARGVGLGGAAARAAYLEVMGTPGIFAERLELEGLAEVLGAPLHLYYHLSGGDAAAAAGAAAEVINPPLGEVVAPPVCLLHRVAARHFDLLLPAE